MPYRIPDKKDALAANTDDFEDHRETYRGRGGYEPPEPVVTPVDSISSFEDANANASRLFPLGIGDLTEEQRQVYDAVQAWSQDRKVGDGGLLTLGGYAGTGKSTVLSVLANSFEDKQVAFCTFTGKASGVLRKKFREADVWGHAYLGTIHRMMYKPLLGEKGRVGGWERLDSLPYDLLVIDEASMVSEEVFHDLEAYGIPILAVGDHGQLPPIGSNFNLMESPQLRLETIHRQAEGSPIIALAHFIRVNGRLPNAFEVQAFQGIEFEKYAEFESTVERIYTHPDTKLEDIACLAYTNRLRTQTNELVRDIGIPNWRSGPQAGDQVICLRNHGLHVYNGMRGEVTEVVHVKESKAHLDLTVLFKDELLELRAHVLHGQFNRAKTFSDFEEVSRETKFRPRSWKTMGLLFDYGYCMTVHKSQGSSFENVLLLNERPSFVTDDDYRRWLYTAVTRSSKNLCIFDG